MSARELINLASKNGYSVGRTRSNLYRYGTHESGRYVEREFTGSWSEFCKFMKGLLSK